MKNKLIIGFLLGAICCLNALAQSSSTEANPKWYYIQVKGASLTANRVLTELADGTVQGQALTTTDVDAVSKQLWRFELIGTQGYTIINKYSKKQLTVTLAGSYRRLAVVDNTSTLWLFPTSSTTGYKYFKIVNEPAEGTAGEIYVAQQNSSRSYTYHLVTEANRTTDNVLFRCQLNEVPVVSTGNATVWMTIRNPRTNKYLTDAVASAPGTNFTLESLSTGSQAQQWKMIAKENGNVEFVNRATGNMISTVTNLNKYYYIGYTADPAGSAGWKYTPAGSSANQYEIFTTDAHGVISYWNATTDGQSPEIYSFGNTAGSTYAWIFSWAEEISTGIHTSVVQNDIRVYSANKRIYVEGCDEYRITAISGMPVRKDIELPLGVYLVTVKGKTTKIFVK